LTKVPKVALVNYVLEPGREHSPDLSQEVAELREEVATLKKELKALKDLFGKLSQTSAISVSVPTIPGTTDSTQSGVVPLWRFQTHRGQNDLPEDCKILPTLQDRLIKIESQTRMYGTSWQVLQRNLDQLEEKLNAIRKSLRIKSSESKVRFAGWSTFQRGSSSQSEGFTSEGSSQSASKAAHKGHV